jgi:hypothetical protein
VCFGLKEWFTLLRLLLTPTCFNSNSFTVEESVALYQAATDEHWGVDSSKLMKAISVYNFDRHFPIARSAAFTIDFFLCFQPASWITEKTGNTQHCIDCNDRQNRAMESYMRAAPPAHFEIQLFISGRGSFVGVEAHYQHLHPRRDLSRFFEYAGINNVQQAEEGYRSSAQYVTYRSGSKSSADGLTHMYPEHTVVSMIRAVLSFSVTARTVELSWLDDLPPADTTTLYCTSASTIFPTTVRVLVAEVFEQQGRHEEAIRFAQTDLQDYHNLNVPSKVRAGRVLGRCHAALGQHMLSVSAFDAAIDLARSRKLLLSEALSVRGRAVAGRNGTGNSGLHWDEETGRQRLAEVIGRMQGRRDVLERALVLP